ncbi:MAG: universal stress protein, partial [Acidobacteria bacterium]|nr:universal stress protein [Acidobacteriota bacterium]
MFEFKKILLPTDFSEFSHRAMPYIIHWARTFKCEVHLFHGEKEGHPENDADPRFEPLKKELEAEGLTVLTASRSGIAPAPTIFHYAEENGIDLIIMATHGNRGMIRFFLGSVAEEVARTAPCSVLTLRTDEDPLLFWEKKTILVPTDFSRPSEIGVKVSAELADHMAAKVHLVHIIESTVPPSLFMHGVRSYYEMIPELKERTQTLMQKIIDQEFHGNGSYTVREGHVA